MNNLLRRSITHWPRRNFLLGAESPRLRLFSNTGPKDGDEEEVAVHVPELPVQTTNSSLVSLFKNPIVHQLWTARNEAKAVAKTSHGEDDTAGKPPSVSRVEVSYPFSSDPLLLETYRNPWGQMRLGRLIEDLDALAGNIAFFHVNDPDKLIVTASVDRIKISERPQMEVDQHLCGQVTWTGRSSMEIRMLCRGDSSEQEWVEAFVTFVTLDPHTKKSVAVPPLVPSNAEERAHFDAGAARAALRKKRRAQLNTFNPAVDKLANSLLEQAGPLISMPSLADSDSILMSQTTLQNATVAQPQVRNLHNRIFGGYLMRVAFELAFSNCYLFCGTRPVFMEVDEVSFTKPVDVGDLLVFDSRILYTETAPSGDSYVHVQIQAWVTEPENVSAKRANEFHFTFRAPNRKVRKVLPSNIDEARAAAERMIEESGRA